MKLALRVIPLAIFIAAAAGCSAREKREDKIRLSIYVDSYSEQITEDNKIMKKIEDELGYTFDIDYLMGSAEEKLGIMAAGGSYPDIVACGSDALIQTGALIPLDDYITEEDTPNLYRHLKPIWNKICYEDGHLYVIPDYNRVYGEDNEAAYQGPAFWIQRCVLEEAGYPEIRTPDEYFDVIADYKERHPEYNGEATIGFEILAATGYEYCMSSPPAYLAGSPNDGNVIVDQETYRARIYADKDISKKYFKKLNEVYGEGLVDTEGFIQSISQYHAKILSGRVLGMFDQHWSFQSVEDSLRSAGLYDKCYVPLQLTYDDSVRPWYRDVPVTNINQGYGISVNCKAPEAALKFFDLTLSEEWQKIFQWGIEGEDYMVNENGRFYRTEEQRRNAIDSVWKAKNKADAIYNRMPKLQGQFSDGNGTCDSKQPEEFEASLSEYEKNFLAEYNKKNWCDFLDGGRENPIYYPAWSIKLESASEASRVNQELTELSVRYIPKLIMSGGGFDAMWEEYCSEIGKINIPAYEQAINDGIKWRVEHWAD